MKLLKHFTFGYATLMSFVLILSYSNLSAQDFDCLDCHDQGDTDNDHDEVSGYSYNSLACYQCHPDGDH